ncbi:MAG: Zn-ribbon containing protein [Patescibacteria group bacterium]|nr:Zn-ribbon containing protein [Patescibacteria group bacterium]
MPHQCVACGKFIDGGSKEILEGCDDCGGKLFFFIKKSRLEKLQKEEPQLFDLSDDDKKQIEEDVYDILGSDIDSSKPVILDIESIKIVKPGTYELDLVNLFKKREPLIYKLEDGKYIIDLIESFKKIGRK